MHDRTFYFANFEQRELNQSGLTTISPANVAAINAHLLAVGYPGPQISTGIYSNPVHNSNVFAKVDHHFSDSDQFSVRYSLYHVTSINSRGAGGLSAPSASANLDDTDQTVAVSNIATLSPHLVNETRGQFTNSNLQAPPSDPIGPAVSISGVASFGTFSGSPTARMNKLDEVADNLSYQAGAHAIRVGADFLYNDDTITFPRTYRGSYSFSSLANFLAGTYNSSGFTQTFANSVVAQTNPNVGFYAQDEWKVTPAPHSEPGPALRPGVPAHHRHEHQAMFRRAAVLPGPPSPRARRWFAAVTDSSTTAFRCARWPTRCFPRKHH